MTGGTKFKKIWLQSVRTLWRGGDEGGRERKKDSIGR